MKIPRRILRLNDRIGDTLNKELYYRGGWLDIRLLDAIIAGAALVFTAYAWFTKGWIAAGQVALMTVFVTICVLWFFPSNKVMK